MLKGLCRGVVAVAVAGVLLVGCGADEGPEPTGPSDSSDAREDRAAIEAVIQEFAAADSAEEMCATMSTLFKRFVTDEHPDHCVKTIEKSPDFSTEPVTMEIQDVVVQRNKAMADVYIEEMSRDDRMWLLEEYGKWKIQGQGLQPPPEFESLLNLKPVG